MRSVRYAVAMSLDGFIAGPQGEADWIEMDPAVDVAAFFKTFYAQFDTALMGRKTYELVGGPIEGMSTYVFSRTLSPSACHGVTVLAENGIEEVRSGRVKLKLLETERSGMGAISLKYSVDYPDK